MFLRSWFWISLCFYGIDLCAPQPRACMWTNLPGLDQAFCLATFGVVKRDLRGYTCKQITNYLDKADLGQRWHSDHCTKYDRFQFISVVFVYGHRFMIFDYIARRWSTEALLNTSVVKNFPCSEIHYGTNAYTVNGLKFPSKSAISRAKKSKKNLFVLNFTFWPQEKKKETPKTPFIRSMEFQNQANCVS